MKEQPPKIGSGFKEGFGFALGYKLGDSLFNKETSGCLLKTIVIFIVILSLFLLVGRCDRRNPVVLDSSTMKKIMMDVEQYKSQ